MRLVVSVVSKHLRIKSGWLDQSNVSQCPSPNYNSRPADTEISLLVIHNISLPPENFGTGLVQHFFQNKLDCDAHPYFDALRNLEVSAHCFIERDGTLTQFVSFDDRAWHAGASEFEGRSNCNDFSVGVELEGADNIQYTEAQYNKLIELTSCLMASYPRITPERVVGHSDIAPGRKTDPGEAFQWKRFRAALMSER